MVQIIVTLITSITSIICALIAVKRGVQVSKLKKEINQKRSAQTEEVNRLTDQVKKKNWWMLLSGGITVACLLFMIYLFFFKNKWDIDNKVSNADKELSAIIRRGIGKNNYVLPSIFMNVVLDSVKGRLQAEITFTYHVVYLNDTINKARAFHEKYELNRGGEIINFIGSDKVQSGGEKYFWLYEYEAKAGSQRSTVSHFRVIYPKTFEGHYLPDFLDELSNTNEEVFQYPNTEADVIGELLITVSSSTLILRRPDKRNAVIGIPGGVKKPLYFEPEFYHSEKGEYSIIVARFTDISAGDLAQLKVGWN